MEKTIQALTTFIPKKVQFICSEEGDDLYDGINYGIYEQGTEELVAVCVFNESGELRQYHCVNTYEEGNMKRKDVAAIGEKFISKFYPNGLDTYTLQSIIDLDEVFVLNYGIQDAEYGIDIPHVGFSVSVSTMGQIVQFSLDDDPYEIIYPEYILSAVEAKERYLSRLDFECIIRYADKEIFVNGDNRYHLVYRILESAMDIPANGDDPTTVEESNEMKQIDQQALPNKTIYEMIGISEDHRKIGEHTTDLEKIEIWAHSSIDVPEEIDYKEEYYEQMIRVVFNKKDHTLLFVHNGETGAAKGDQEQLSNQALMRHALDLIFTIYPKADEQFYLELPEVVKDEEDFESEDDFEPDDFLDEYDEEHEHEEEAEVFYFHRVVNGVVIDEKVTCIQVGKYTGNITGMFGDPVNQEVIDHLSTKPRISKEKAKQLYAKDLIMELTFSLEFNEDDAQKMILTYVPSFPKTTGHIQMIDAHTGQAYFVDVGDSEFF